MIKNFRALVTKQNKDGTFENIVEQKTTKELPEGDLLIRVE